jgi:hypothetical protein
MKRFTVKIASTTDNLTEDSLNYLLENVKGTPFKNEKVNILACLKKDIFLKVVAKRLYMAKGIYLMVSITHLK